MSVSEPFEEASKRIPRYPNRGLHWVLGSAWKLPPYWSGGIRRRGSMTLVRAFVRNLRTGDDKGRGSRGATTRPKIPRRRPGADGSVRAMKRGNARGAKGAGHLRRVGVKGQPEELSNSAEAGRLPRGGTSRMRRESHVRICERLGVKFPGATRLLSTSSGPTFPR